MSRGGAKLRSGVALLSGVLLLAACGPPSPSPTPYPSGATFPPASQAEALAQRFAEAWSKGEYAAMWKLLAPADQERYPEADFAGLLTRFAELTRVNGLTFSTAAPVRIALPPEPRPPDLPAPTPTPSAAASGAPASATSTPTPAPSASGSPAALPGPVPGLGVPLVLAFRTDLFGAVNLARQLPMTDGADGWQVRWSPSLLFPELADGATLKLERTLSPRGRIVSTSGAVFAETRKDGTRVYPQEWLAGQTIGYVSEVTAEDLKTLAAKGYRAGDVVGRSGLEYGAEDLLRGSPGFTLAAVPAGGKPLTLLERPMVPGADVTITIRPQLQASAEAGLAGHNNGSTAVVDPQSGDVWALASAPAFNPNAMTLGTTLDGRRLARPGSSSILNKAVRAAYPAGSSFKPFTLAAALKIGVATPATRMACPGTWTFSGFTFHNYKDHSLPGLVSLAQAMAFSCNTTYMPLSIRVYDKDETALTDLIREFGFGQSTGIRHLVDETGILPDADYFASLNPPRQYGPFDQIQLAIGQGSFTGTALQLANAYAAFGNGGTLWTPRIVVKATLPDGKVVEQNDPQVKHQVSLSKAQLAYVVQCLEAVINLPYGTGHNAFAGFGLQVAGKSGTAENGTPDPHALFPAFAPAAKPQIAVATIQAYYPLGTGGDVSAPLVRRVMARYFASR
ncbi:MAG TPA: penicillin-binding transpeptidase domain-containing protein [Candidatus Limnocylindria bacterium]|nr:penicillin-binding transpeptidase domain-containing protein [Candidatus Limnocylindria bacterium]